MDSAWATDLASLEHSSFWLWARHLAGSEQIRFLTSEFFLLLPQAVTASSFGIVVPEIYGFYLLKIIIIF